MAKFKTGQLITIEYEGREFQVIVIDPNGLGKDQPSVGFGYRMMERNAGIPNDTLSRWTIDAANDDSSAALKAAKLLKPPSGNTFRVLQIKGEDNNNYTVVEATDWFDLAFDVLKNPGRTGKGVKTKLLDFVKWFAIKGFYAEAYTALKGSYTTRDSKTLSKWLLSRLSGIVRRNEYTDFLKSQGCEGWDYAYWTDYVYTGLFSKTASQMKQFWKLVEGSKRIGRNYIPEAEGLDAVAYCEEMTVKLHIQNLEQAHNDAIRYTLAKFFESNQPQFDIDLED